MPYHNSSPLRVLLKNHREIVYLILPLPLLLIVFFSVFQPERRFIGEFHDIMVYVNANLFMQAHPFSLWNNYWLFGFPDYAAPMSDRYYPLSLPFYLLSRDMFVVNFIMMLHLYIAYLSFYRLGSIVTGNSGLRMISSLIYMFSGVLTAQLTIGHTYQLYALVWIPLLYYYLMKIVCRSERTTENAVLLAVSAAMIFFAGAVYYSFYSFIVCAVFSAYALAGKRFKAGLALILAGSAVIFLLIISIKSIPLIEFAHSTVRVDPINPLEDGGSLENNLASILFGTPVDKVFGWFESSAFVGIITAALMIIGLVFGDAKLTVPSFLSMAAAFAWADGGRSVLSFMHLLPVLNNFRVAGRVLGAVEPLVILLALHGFCLLYERVKNGEELMPDSAEKKRIKVGVTILILLKITELPYQSGLTDTAIASLILLSALVALIYWNRLNRATLIVFFTAACIVQSVFLFRDPAASRPELLWKCGLSAALIALVILLYNRHRIRSIRRNPTPVILYAALVFVIAVNCSRLITSEPGLEKSPAHQIISTIKKEGQGNIQTFVMETGWPFQHMDFAHLLIKNGLHPVRANFAYFLKNTPSVKYPVNNIEYYSIDYIVDTANLENSRQNIPAYTFKVGDIAVFRPSHVLPDVFVLRGQQFIPVTVRKFTSDETIIEGQFRKGDSAVLKTSYYPGWKVNGGPAQSNGNMVWKRLSGDSSSVRFSFEPSDYRIGIAMSCSGVLLIAFLLYRRRMIDSYLADESRQSAADAGVS